MATSSPSPQPGPAAQQAHLLASQLLNPTTPTNYVFTFTPFLRQTHQHSLPRDRPVCRSFATTGSCPLKTRCPERHVSSAPPQTSSSGAPPFGSLVCKHWLRGLCKKGEGCEFLHEYNLRKMPECNFFVRNGYCSNGDECLYLHIDPESKLPPCPWFERGFCPLGPRCGKKHVLRSKGICPYYMAGFCPEGRKVCKEGAHPKWTPDKEMEKPRAKVERTREEEEEVKRAKEEEMRERQREREERDGFGGGRGGGFRDRGGRGGGGGGGWRGKRGGGGGFRGGRGH